MYITTGAQCFPRLACPLIGAVLMQVHEPAQAAPGLMLEGVKKVRGTKTGMLKRSAGNRVCTHIENLISSLLRMFLKAGQYRNSFH